MEYNFKEIERKWREEWSKNKLYKTDINPDKPKYYVLDMFPYPSGAGLHVGHPLGYIASDIYSRYMRLKGFNVLHPMGYDAFGLPAEQYAIQTGQHPALTTAKNVKRYREQLDLLGFSFDWSREVQTCDPAYYKWTQWTFTRLFNSWYDKDSSKARSIAELIIIFETSGSSDIHAHCSVHDAFTADEWKNMDEKQQQEILMNYRLAYLADTMVNWCPALGTVLANDEVSEGFSVRGGHPVERKLMKQWSLRITAYSDRLLEGLERIDWPENIKEIQRNWIGRSEGAMLRFQVKNHPDKQLEIFTTRPDTVFGVTFMSVAPEHEWVNELTTGENRASVEKYVHDTTNRSERERMADAANVSGVFSGSYAINPFNGDEIPIWVADYVLSGYGTGAVMAVPAHDSRDYRFANHFGLPIKEVISGGDISAEAFESKDGICVNSGFINGMVARDAIKEVIRFAEEHQFGKGKVNYRLRDAIFSRQRYWGEPFPVYYKNNMPYVLDDDKLPLELPEIDKYLPTETGEPPLARAQNWQTSEGFPYETSTMPGFAGSSAYYFRYMDPQNTEELVSDHAVNYWQNVDLYIGGAEHATGHLIYSRFWNKFLFDIGLVPKDEPFQKMINQGMIQGRSNFVYRVKPEIMAEYVMWENIRDNKTGVSFSREYKDGHRQFDFFCEKEKIIIEIKPQDNLEKVEEQYKTYARENGYRILLFNVAEVVINTEKTLGIIRDVISGKEAPGLRIYGFDLNNAPIFVSKNIPGREQFSFPVHVDVNLVKNDILDTDAFRTWMPEYVNAMFILEDNKYICGWEVEKMSKSKFNVQNPDDLVEQYGADTLRMYEMFLGPVEQSKPWDTNGIEGVHRFLRKLWRLFYDEREGYRVNDEIPSTDELKILHRTLHKVKEDIERFSFNTAVSNFMICVNQLSETKCYKRSVLEPLLIALSPYAPHISEELWNRLGNSESIHRATYPSIDEKYLADDTFNYPVSFNGKMRFTIEIDASADPKTVEEIVLASEHAAKWLQGATPKKVIVVKGRIVNIVM